jgi:hypothetical protein
VFRRAKFCAPVDKEYDLVLVGSDEVWNLKHPWYGGSALFYGEGLRPRRLASYAASFGNCVSSGGIDAYWADRLRAFECLSVRDLNTRQIIQDSVGIEPALALDPCLKFPRSIRRIGSHQAERPYVGYQSSNRRNPKTCASSSRRPIRTDARHILLPR